MLSFKTTNKEFDTIAQIADRAVALAEKCGVRYTKRDALMDLTATHANGCLLRLDELLNAPDGDFAHDVFGIWRHIDRTTGRLQDCFVPRFALSVTR